MARERGRARKESRSIQESKEQGCTQAGCRFCEPTTRLGSAKSLAIQGVREVEAAGGGIVGRISHHSSAEPACALKVTSGSRPTRAFSSEQKRLHVPRSSGATERQELADR